ncbi:MAG: hypothetical protein KDB90_03550 [Planctomycetes bacterium]|nr:hypothetical protein [Planctomycetota bacterium]
MVHIVEIINYVPRAAKPGRIEFRINGNTYHAKCYADPELADGLFVEGTSYPVSLSVETEGRVEYANAGEPVLEVVTADAAGDRVKAVGRTWEGVDHQMIKLDSEPSVGLKLNLPQTASDYRGGSWLSAVGLLCADLPPEDHD